MPQKLKTRFAGARSGGRFSDALLYGEDVSERCQSWTNKRPVGTLVPGGESNPKVLSTGGFESYLLILRQTETEHFAGD